MQADSKPVEVKSETKKVEQSKTVQLSPYQAMLKAQWEQTPGRLANTPLPIYIDKEGAPIWVNRHQRRKAVKLNNLKPKPKRKLKRKVRGHSA